MTNEASSIKGLFQVQLRIETKSEKSFCFMQSFQIQHDRLLFNYTELSIPSINNQWRRLLKEGM